MSAEQFSALLAQLQEDSGLIERLNGAADLDAAVAIAKDAGFDVTQDDLNNYQASQGSISAEELAAISGGKINIKENMKVGLKRYEDGFKPGSVDWKLNNAG